MGTGPTNSAAPTTSQPVAAVYNATTPTPADTQALALQADSSGNLKVNVVAGGTGGNASVGATGTTAPTSATEIGIIVGGNLVGVSSSNPVPISGSISATNPSVGTDGAAAPTSSTQVGGSDGTNLQPLQVDGSKNLKTVINAALPAGTNVIGHVITDTGSTTAVTGTVTVSGVVSQSAIPADSTPATQNVTVVDSGSTTTPGFDSQSIITGSPTANSAASFVVSNLGTVRVQVSGTWTGTLQSELSMDGGTTWYIAAVHLNGTSFTAATFTGNFQGEAQGSGITNYRLRATAAITGTAVVTITKTNTISNVNVVTPIRLQDATTQSIGGTIKAASTAAVATDTALVVALSPNSSGITSANLPESTAAWTSATALNTALQVNVAGYNTVVVTLNQGSTIAGGAATFEGSDTTAFTNAYSLLSIKQNDASTAPNVAVPFSASTNVSYIVDVSGMAAFRIRLSTVITGSATINVGVVASANSITFPKISSFITSTTSAVADNITQVVGLVNGNSSPMNVAEEVYGGAFSGAAQATLQGWSKKRTPTVFKTIQATASGNTAVWTPGTGNKFRLLKLFVQLTDNASLASGAVLTISLQDSTTAMPIAFDVFVPTTAVTTTIGDGLEQELDLGDFGIQSAAANNVLNVNLSAALATGNARIIAMGTEE